jgi:hypothetical protein
MKTPPRSAGTRRRREPWLELKSSKQTLVHMNLDPLQTLPSEYHALRIALSISRRSSPNCRFDFVSAVGDAIKSREQARVDLAAVGQIDS